MICIHQWQGKPHLIYCKQPDHIYYEDRCRLYGETYSTNPLLKLRDQIDDTMSVAVGQTKDSPGKVKKIVEGKSFFSTVYYEYQDLLWVLQGSEHDLKAIEESNIRWQTFFISRISKESNNA